VYVTDQVECARVLLFRGADKTLKNLSHQDAALVAVVSGNSSMSNLIKEFKHEDVGEWGGGVEGVWRGGGETQGVQTSGRW